MSLQISETFALPVDVAGEAIAILAKRGAGKTNTATVLVEELVVAGVQTVVLDPVGAWWGLRSSADGKTDGLQIPILGGEHGDVQIEQTAGALIADVAIESGQSLVVDLSDLPSKAAVGRFVTDFAERLYRKKARARSLLHVVLEEADEFAPQGQRADTARMRGAIEQLVRRGRSRGLGVTLISQRSAVLNKDVLTQADLLIVMRTTGPHDLRAIRQWVTSRGDERGDEVLQSLPALTTGEAWIWNPERDLLQRLQVRRRQTFDSSTTPKAGAAKVEPAALAAIDLAALGEQIAATAAKAKAEDPRELRRQIAQLKRELGKQPTREVEVERLVEKRIEVPIEVPAIADDHLNELREIVATMRDLSRGLAARADQIEEALRHVQESVDRRPAERAERAPRPDRAHARPPARRQERDVREATAEDEAPSAYALGLLETLARHHPMQLTRAQISTFSGRRPRSSSFSAAMTEIVRDGWATVGPSGYELTDAGLELVGQDAEAPTTTEELLELWRSALPAYERGFLDALVAAYPNGLSREELAEQTGRSLTSSSFSAAISTLVKNGLAEASAGEVRAAKTLFVGVLDG